MFYLVFALILIVFCIIILWSFVDVCINYGFKETIRAKWTIPVVIFGIICGICAIPIYQKHIQKVQSDAIDHYIVGDVEIHEKVVDGEVVDWQYVVIPADYDW